MVHSHRCHKHQSNLRTVASRTSWDHKEASQMHRRWIRSTTWCHCFSLRVVWSAAVSKEIMMQASTWAKATLCKTDSIHRIRPVRMRIYTCHQLCQRLTLGRRSLKMEANFSVVSIETLWAMTLKAFSTRAQGMLQTSVRSVKVVLARIESLSYKTSWNSHQVVSSIIKEHFLVCLRIDSATSSTLRIACLLGHSLISIDLSDSTATILTDKTSSLQVKFKYFLETSLRN